MKDNTHQAHAQSSQQDEYGMMFTTAKWYSGTLGGGGLKFPDICLTGEEKPRKKSHPGNLSRLGSNLGPLRDKHACYHLLHSGGRVKGQAEEKK